MALLEFRIKFINLKDCKLIFESKFNEQELAQFAFQSKEYLGILMNNGRLSMVHLESEGDVLVIEKVKYF